MRLALISDIHGNLEALDTVLEDIDARTPGARIVCAGDIVGYGPDPDACVDRLRSRGIPCVMGNHEEMVLGRRNFSRCVHAGITAAVWTRREISAATRGFLERLPRCVEAAPGVIVCHGDLADADTYVSDAERADDAIAQLHASWPDARTLVCGHTHHAALYSQTTGFERVSVPGDRELHAGMVYVVNPGAVGQSRAGAPLACYAVLDSRGASVSFRALAYDHRTTIAKMCRAGLVPSVVLQRPTGIWRYIESWKRRWARYWAERAPTGGNGT
ncbi:MAG TPA: metallophosphoesterase family protein [Planctomycetota bacterium]|nr:metallophosphoesterase family protein [Planctomycetota bacterium]